MNPSPDAKENISRFEKLLAVLVNDGIDFAVAGGVAVIFNGYPRLTLDVDILINDKMENLHKLLGCLALWGEGWAKELKTEDFTPQPGAIRVTEDFDLDIFTRMEGLGLDYFRPRLHYLETGKIRIPYLSPEDLIFLKKNSSRDKDKLDVAALNDILISRKKDKTE